MSTNGLLKQKFERYIVVFKTISKLTSNEKVYFRNKNIYVQSNSIKTALDRTISGDNRFDMITNFNEILDDLELISTTNASNELIDRIKNSLFLSISSPNKGFYNLVETYSQDHFITSSIENIIDRINIMLKGYGMNINLES